MKRNYGLQVTPPDDRDFSLGAITILPSLSEIPKEMRLSYYVKNQLSSDFCSAYMSCAMSETQEGVRLEPSYSFALSKEISGDVDTWGQNIRDALKAHIKYGAIREDMAPYSVNNQSPQFLRDIKNWPDLKDAALPFRKKSFFKVTGQYDHFDNARASIAKFKSPIGTGVNFGWPLSQVILNTIPKRGVGHAITIVGYTVLENGNDALIMRNSYGPESGDQGVHYITRDVYNHFAEIYGQHIFIDLDKDDAKYRLERGITLEDNWIIQLWKSLKTFLWGR